MTNVYSSAREFSSATVAATGQSTDVSFVSRLDSTLRAGRTGQGPYTRRGSRNPVAFALAAHRLIGRRVYL